MRETQFAIIGSGIAGCSVAYFLQQHTKDILIIDKNSEICGGASKAAGAFLSPLLGKKNEFKTLVSEALRFSTKFYKDNFPQFIINNGVLRIPKNSDDEQKFLNYEHDFEFEQKDGGAFFPIGSLVFSQKMAQAMCENVEHLLNYEVTSLEFLNDYWIINGEIKAKNVILSTGAKIELAQESYIKIRPVWGQRIIVKSDLSVSHNYHKNCSISPNVDGFVSIGATHHRFVYEKETTLEDSKKLLELANEILPIGDPQIVNSLGGARSASEDYFPILGQIIDSKATLNQFAYIIHGTKVSTERFTRYKNLFIINGVGGRGFVLSPYLAKMLCDFIFDNLSLNPKILADRFFLREVRK